MENFGKTFRKIRKQRKITLKELVGSEISYSALATFEREESMLSFEMLALLLKKLQLSLDEFYCLSLITAKETEYDIFSKQAANFLHTNNTKQLEKLAEIELQKFIETNLLFHKCNSIICKTVASTLKHNTHISKVEKDFINDYLWQVEIWTKYELSVLNYTLPIIPLKSLRNFINEIWKSIPDDFLMDKLHTYKFNVVNSIIAIFIENAYFTDAKKWIKKLRVKLNNSQEFFQMTYLYILELTIMKYENPSDDVEGAFQELKNTLINIGATNYATHFEIAWNAVGKIGT